MSVSYELSNLTRLEGQLHDIDRKIGDRESKEADLFKRVNDAQKSASRASTTSSVASYLRQADNYQSQIGSVKSEKVRLHGERSRKQDEIRRCKERLSREEASERKREDDNRKREQQKQVAATKAAEGQMRRDREADLRIRAREAEEREALRAEIEMLKSSRSSAEPQVSIIAAHDFFISHASEDKEGFVRDLANALREAGHEVWYDEFSLKVGDKLRRSIERGIANSKFGVVVLSPDFFKKEWPQRELDALFELDTGDVPRILPIWHRVSYDEVAKASPMLAGRLALKTAVQSLDEIVAQLGERIS